MPDEKIKLDKIASIIFFWDNRKSCSYNDCLKIAKRVKKLILKQVLELIGKDEIINKEKGVALNIREITAYFRNNFRAKLRQKAGERWGE